MIGTDRKLYDRIRHLYDAGRFADAWIVYWSNFNAQPWRKGQYKQKMENDFETCPIGTIELLKASENYIRLLEQKNTAPVALAMARSTYHDRKARRRACLDRRLYATSSPAQSAG